MNTQTENATGERMVSFDLNVAAANGALPISYDRALNSCTLTCHNHTHGTIAAATSLTMSKPK
jgi:hypothetical protein